jgi:magnesium chelatase family protein
VPTGVCVLASTFSATVLGADGLVVTVEAHVGAGLPGFTMVGLPDASCREVAERARAATQCSGLSWPARRTTVNLAPSAERKVGSSLDLAVALAVLAADRQVPAEALRNVAFIGELGLDGGVRPVPGVIAMVDALPPGPVVVPRANALEATLTGRHEVLATDSLRRTVDALRGVGPWATPPGAPDTCAGPVGRAVPDLAEVRGHPVGRRALEVAAAGGHNLLFVGPPGSGKTMLAERLPGILPPLDGPTALEATRIHSAAGQALPVDGRIRRAPFRAPHHGTSAVAMVGGGSHQLRPGEASLAHGGVLFLDELGEFAATVLDALRTPLEEGVVRIARANLRMTVPARFVLVGAMNPCPCGAAGGPGSCRCSTAALDRYARRLSGPLLDRFDLQVHLPVPPPSVLFDTTPGEPSVVVARRVADARHRADRRGVGGNAALRPGDLERAAPLDDDAQDALEEAVIRNRISGRGLRRLRAVALTLADLDGRDPPLRRVQVLEAMALRQGVTGGVQ